ncbi:hypothetical protein [Actinoplanes sp. M2I2]|uniref:hypothetical protein n=1 Tax=Actinoplanes sp. M2I2 TaxID=1734444 RepID=UPI0020210A04|nr:hypothetical protein [Actinoplanes sp. M2I2]
MQRALGGTDREADPTSRVRTLSALAVFAVLVTVAGIWQLKDVSPQTPVSGFFGGVTVDFLNPPDGQIPALTVALKVEAQTGLATLKLRVDKENWEGLENYAGSRLGVVVQGDLRPIRGDIQTFHEDDERYLNSGARPTGTPRLEENPTWQPPGAPETPVVRLLPYSAYEFIMPPSIGGSELTIMAWAMRGKIAETRGSLTALRYPFCDPSVWFARCEISDREISLNEQVSVALPALSDQ